MVLFIASGRGQERHMCGNDSPSIGKTHPGLALSAARYSLGGISFKFNGNAGKIASEAHDFKPCDGAHQVVRRSRFAKGFQLFVAVQIFRHTEAHDLRRGPEHGYQGVNIICDERLFVARIELAKFGDYFGKVYFLRTDCHTVVKSSRWGRICLLMAALTVYIGSLTTWLSRNLSATLHRM